jgi:hypothetical protein
MSSGREHAMSGESAAGVVTLALLLVVSAWTPSQTETKQRNWSGDTTVVRVNTAGMRTGRLVEEISIGGIDATDPYRFGYVSDVAVGADGSIYVADEATPSVRQYDVAGKFVRSFGSRGSGPGEYGGAASQMNGRTKGPRGVAVFNDGRVVVHSSVGHRLNVYGASGKALVTATEPGLFYLPEQHYHPPLVLAADDGAIYSRLWWPVAGYTKSPLRPRPPAHYLRMRADGSRIDTIPEPVVSVAQPYVAFMKGGVPSSERAVPFTAGFSWTLSKRGYFVTGDQKARDGSYAVDLRIPEARVPARSAPRWSPGDRVISLRVPFTPVDLLPAERKDWTDDYTAYFGQGTANWRWHGEAIPQQKPAYRSLWSDDDGRIWINLYSRATEDRRQPRSSRKTDGTVGIGWAALRWPEPQRFDVLDASGRFVGRVLVPASIHLQAARGDQAWAIVEDEWGPLTVKRFRIAWESGTDK